MTNQSIEGSNNPFFSFAPHEGASTTTNLNNATPSDSNVTATASEFINSNTNPFSEDIESQPMSNVYQDLHQNSVFKTTNRIIDDIKILLRLNRNSSSKDSKKSILRSHPLEYSKDLANSKYNPYVLNILAESPVEAKVEVRKSFDNPDDEVITLRGLIFDSSESRLSHMKVHHLRIVIKTKHSHRAIHVTKNEYYLVQDEDLYPGDQRDLILPEILDESKVNFEAAKEFLPDLEDYATFVCSKTQKMLRIEISKPEFTFEDLNDFEIGPINVRFRHAQTKYENLDEVPSPSECMHTLYKTLLGPLRQDPKADTQSIVANNKTLNSTLNLNLLVKKLNFKLSNNKFVPVNFSNYTEEPNSFIVRESFIRKLHESLLLGTKAYSAGRKSPFSGFKFTSELSTIFENLQDNASVRNHHDLLKDANYINISAFPFYSDELIVKCYCNTVDSDIGNLPIYYDSIRDIGSKKSTAKLSQFLQKLSLQGIIGQREIDEAYVRLLGQSEGHLADDDTILSAYLSEKMQNQQGDRLRNALITIAKVRASERIHKFLAYEALPIEKAYEIMGINKPEEISDDIIPTLLDCQREDLQGQDELLNRVFITIATERKSAYLLNMVEIQFPDIVEPPSDYATACKQLAVDKDHAEDIQIIEIFRNVTAGNQIEIKQARAALRVIGEHKDSDLIRQYLLTGNLDSSLIPAYDWPVGLANIGNTCYLNSILQYLFTVKPVREFVLNFNGTMDNEEAYLQRTLGGSKLTSHQLERSFQLVYHLQNLFRELVESPERVVSPSKELAFLVFLRFEDTVEFIRESSKREEKEPKDLQMKDRSPSSSSTEEFDSDIEIIEKPMEEEIVVISEAEPDFENKHLTQDQDGEMELNETMGTIKAGEYGSSENQTESESEEESVSGNYRLLAISEEQMHGVDANSQQDAQECLSNVILQIEAVIPPELVDKESGEQLDFFKNLFFGKTLQRLVSLTYNSDVRTKKEIFANLIVNVQTQPRTLYDGLDETFGTQRVEWLSSYRDKYERIIDIPTILQIQFQRVFYDRKLMSLKKNNHGIQYPQELYMDRYMDTDDPELIQKREEVEEMKETLRGYKERLGYFYAVDEQGMTIREALIHTKGWLYKMNTGSDSLLKELENKIDHIPEEIEGLNTKISELEDKIDHHFDDYQEHAYTLFAVFIHKGEASYGHYWIYLNDMLNGYFRKYNDENVTRAPESDVFDISSRERTTAYFLGYVKKGFEKDIDALVRSRVSCFK